MFGLIMKIFNGLLTDLVSGSNHTKCVSLSNQKCKIQPTLISLHANEYNQEFHYYPFAVKLDRCVGSGNTLNDLSNKVSVPNKTEDLNIYVSNMITGKNESKILTKGISCKCKCRFDKKNVMQVNNGAIMIKVDLSVKMKVCEKDYIWNPATCSCENGKYLASIVDDSAIKCDEIIDADAEARLYNEAKPNDEEAKTFPTNFNEKK